MSTSAAAKRLWRHRPRPRTATDTAPAVQRAHDATSSSPSRHRRKAGPRRVVAWAVVVATLLLCLAAGSRVRDRSLRRAMAQSASLLAKRDSGDGNPPPIEDHGHGSLLRIPYDKVYDSCPPALQPLFVALLVNIIAFLFCTISITASDFFCPNLATAAAYLGLSETTAGVTLLAFGNGSPDVFSTFVSVQQNTFGLAVGELIGAASFITSIVVGCIAMVQPFHVPKVAFLRDVTFFTIAVLLLMLVLADGELTLRESGGMVALYALYVAVVVVGSWWSARRRRREAFTDLGWKTHDEEEVLDASGMDVELPTASESLTLTLHTPDVHRRRQSSASRLTFEDRCPDEEQMADTQRANWSLLGAVEFRDAVNALKREGHTPSSSAGNSRPTSPLRISSHEHDNDYFHRGHRRGSSQGLSMSREASLRLTGRSRSSSLVAGWLSRARLEEAEGHTGGPATAPLEVVPGSPWSGTTPTDHTPQDNPSLHPAQQHESHPLAALGPRLNELRQTSLGNQEDEPLSPVSARHVPAISVVDPEGSIAAPDLPLTRNNTTASLVHAARNTLHRVLHTLFPSLQGFTKKSFAGMILAVLSTPALLLLTVTLPVVDDGRGDEGAIALPGAENETLGSEQDEEGVPELTAPRPRAPRSSHTPCTPVLAREIGPELHHLVESGGVPVCHHPHHLPESSALVRSGVSCPPSDDGNDEEECVLEFSPALTAAQCVCGPIVCIWLLFQDEDWVLWAMLGAATVGVAAATLVMLLAEDGTAQPWRLVRCCAGFVCSMVWIATVADEVVSVLQTFGEIFGLSDAIIGLTIFAVGNSLADLVANVTIAQFAPNMAYSACFGGPMLNLLLGIGGSGSWSILTKPSHPPVTIDFSPTLWVSGTGLIVILATTALVVPLNSFFIDRRWALCLLLGYAALMTTNVVVEIRSERRK